MMRRAVIAAAMLAAGAAHGQVITAIRTAAGGLDVDTANVVSVMPESLWTNCAAWFPFSRELAAGTYYDYGPRQLASAQTNSPHRATWSALGLGSYLFDGTNDWINCGNPSLNTASGTMAFWTRHVITATAVRSSAAMAITDAGDAGNAQVYLGVYSTNGTTYGLIVVRAGSETRYVHRGNSVIPTGTWAHVALVQSGASAPVLYVDAVAQSLTKVGSSTENAGAWWDDYAVDMLTIGDRWTQNPPPAFPYQGEIDAPMVFTRALTATEIGQVFTNTSRGHK